MSRSRRTDRDDLAVGERGDAVADLVRLARSWVTMNTVRPSVFCRVPMSSSKSPAAIGSSPRSVRPGTRSRIERERARQRHALVMPPESSDGNLSASCSASRQSQVGDRDPVHQVLRQRMGSRAEFPRFAERSARRTARPLERMPPRPDHAGPCGHRWPSDNFDAPPRLDEANDSARQNRLAPAGRADEAEHSPRQRSSADGRSRAGGRSQPEAANTMRMACDWGLSPFLTLQMKSANRRPSQ